MEKACDTRQELDVLVLPDAGIVRGDTPRGFHRGRFGEDECGAADGAATQMHQVPIVEEAVLAGVLAHRRHGDAVAQRDFANLEGREQSHPLQYRKRGLEEAVSLDELPEHLPDLHKFVVRNRLSKIAGAQLGRPASVGRGIRGSDHQNRNIPELLTGANSAEHFEPVDLRKIEVEQQQMRSMARSDLSPRPR